MDLSDLQTLIGSLTNDPNHDRYTTTDIGTELDNVQNEWNAEIGIIKDSVSLDVTADDRTYALSGLTGTPIMFTRVTHRGILLKKRDKSWFDLYVGGQDWSDDTGTPREYYIDAKDPDVQQIVLYPVPQDVDAGTGYLVVEYIKAHTSMSASDDEPFNDNTLLRPYHHGLAYTASYRLLARDPDQAALVKATEYKKIGNEVKANVIQIYSGLEREAPYRLRGGRFPSRGLRTLY